MGKFNPNLDPNVKIKKILRAQGFVKTVIAKKRDDGERGVHIV